MTWALENAPVTDATALLVLIALADRASEDGTAAFPSQEWIAQRARCSVRTVRRKLADLEDAGIIRKGDPRYVQHIRQDRRPTVWNVCMWQGTTGHNRVPSSTERPDTGDRGDKLSGRTEPCPVVPPEREDITVSYPPKSGRTPVVERPDTGDRTTGHLWSNDRTQLCPTNRPEPSLTVPEPSIYPESETTPEIAVTQTTATKRQTYPPDFNEFWNVLPSEKKNGKKNAYAQWKKAIRVIPKDELLRILEQHIAYHQAKDGHCQYLQDPERWLRNQRWEDELAPLRQQSTPGRAKSAAEINAERRGQPAPQFAINGLPVIDGYIEPQPQITR